MTWCLAESAPKTGEHILVSNHGRGDFGMCGGKTQDFCAVVHYWDNPGEEGFYLSNGYPHPEDVETPIHFTHWLPLDVLGTPRSAALSVGGEPPALQASPATAPEAAEIEKAFATLELAVKMLDAGRIADDIEARRAERDARRELQ